MLDRISLPRLRENNDPLLPCEQDDPELWFAKHPRAQVRAITKCYSCPVREQCLAQALELERHDGAARFGIYGGVTANSRFKMAKKLGHNTVRKKKQP